MVNDRIQYSKPTPLQKPIDIRFYLLFIPVAFGSYLFHELGHWTVGEILGNRMVYSLNFVWPKSGAYLHGSDELYVSIAGPAFSVLLALFALLVIRKYKSIYVYPIAFFPMFNRFFSILLGGFSRQDEARVSAVLGIGSWTVAIVVLTILLSIVVWCSYRLQIALKTNGYAVTASTFCQLLVIGTYTYIRV